MRLTLNIPVSFGELVDKITILEIKALKITNKEKQKKINEEFSLLNKKFEKFKNAHSNKLDKLKEYKNKLYNLNKKLWDIEDCIRKLETKKDFGPEFIKLARSVYLNNDKRAGIKNKINQLMQSRIQDIKQYFPY